jgi:hypothetical protein
MAGPSNFTHATCTICGKHSYVTSLHGDKGGPPCCLFCAGQWHGKQGRRRRLGRIVIRAMKAFQEGGGNWRDLDKLKLSASGLDKFGFGQFLDLDPLGYLANTAADTDGENIELTSELLSDTVRLTHPDQHPPERKELAHRVTQGLLALKPFVFPAPKPVKNQAQLKPDDVTAKTLTEETEKKSLRYPCPECADTVPLYYCTACRTEWEKRQEAERKKEAAKRRAWYARRKERHARFAPPTTCATCGQQFKGKRKDARFCSDRCRQKAHRKSVTGKNQLSGQIVSSRDADGVTSSARHHLNKRNLGAHGVEASQHLSHDHKEGTPGHLAD